jgi:hypothetical protein
MPELTLSSQSDYEFGYGRMMQKRIGRCILTILPSFPVDPWDITSKDDVTVIRLLMVEYSKCSYYRHE